MVPHAKRTKQSAAAKLVCACQASAVPRWLQPAAVKGCMVQEVGWGEGVLHKQVAS